MAAGLADVQRDRAVDPGLDSFASVDGDDASWGWNVGVLWDLDKDNRIGLAWRSDISYTSAATRTSPTRPIALPPGTPPPLAGDDRAFSAGVNPKRLYNGGIKSDIKLPGIANISWFGHVSDRWDVMADVQWTHWSTIQNLTFTRTDGTECWHSTPLNFDGCMAVLAGRELLLRRPVEVPDGRRLRPVAGAGCVPHPAAAGLGPHLARGRRAIRGWNQDLRFDLGARYIWVKDGSINNAGYDPTTGQPSVARMA